MNINWNCKIKSFSDSEMVAVIDGSWIIGSDRGEIGGIFRNKSKKLQVLFAGHTLAWAGFDAELLAFKTIMHHRAAYISKSQLTICTDSRQLVDDFYNFIVLGLEGTKVGQLFDHENSKTDGLIIKFIERTYNK